MAPNQIKICGITIVEEALKIAQMGVGALGFIFYPPSPRYLPLEKAQALIFALPPFVQKIGVFVNSPLEEIEKAYTQTKLDCVQLHGEESPEFTKALSQKNIPWYKAFRIRPNFDFQQIQKYSCEKVLLDSFDEKAHGGTGKIFDWQSLKNLTRSKKIILSGGLNTENVQTAIQLAKPDALDASSGVEVSPGKKDLEKVKKFIHQACPRL